MDFSFSSLMTGFVFGVIGFWLFKQGKGKGNVRWIVIGLAMLIFPYFISNVLISWLLGVGLCFAAYSLR